jgi:hypothetical protein
MSIGISSGPESSGSPVKDVAAGQTQANVLIEKPIMAKVIFSETLPQIPAKLAEQLQAAMPDLTAPLYRIQLGIGQQKLITYSQTPLPAGEIVQVSPRADGQLQAMPLPKPDLSLNLATLTKTLLNMPVLDTAKLPQLPPPSVLNPAQVISPELVKQAITHSGQFFEKLLLNPTPTNTAALNPTTPNMPATRAQPASATLPLSAGTLPTSTPHTGAQRDGISTKPTTHNNITLGQPTTAAKAPAPNVNSNWQKLQQNVKNMGLWLDQTLAGKTPKGPLPTLTLSHHPTPNTGVTTPIIPMATANPLSGKSAGQPVSFTHSALQLDFKGWLIATQHALKEHINQQLLSRGDSTKPWLPDSFAASASLNKNPTQGVWPRNLSWQPILLSTLQETDQTIDNKQDTLVKLLLQVTQSLGRIQQDQAGNRQQQSVNPQTDINLQLPYLEQQQVRFVEIELQEKNTQLDNRKQQVRAWHMILRFEQASPFPFAIELSLHSMQVNLHCWAQHAAFVSALREKLPVLRKKLSAAGFSCQQLDTRLGNPAPLKRQIQQYRVDVHT